MGLAQNVPQRMALDLNSVSRVLVFGTERDTDPDLYTQLVGCSGADVAARAAVLPTP